MKYRLLTFLFLLISINIVAQKNIEHDSIVLDSVQISGYSGQNTIKAIPKSVHLLKLHMETKQVVSSIDDVLALLASADIRTRGSKGMQSDISIRGGNFDQILVLLNGVKINNPQTGHHNLDIPIDISMIDRIEFIEGPAGQSFGVNAYSGVINFITKNPSKEQGNMRVKIGQFGYLKTAFELSHSFNNIHVYNGFSYQKSDGYLSKSTINNTDFYDTKDFLSIRIDTKHKPINIQAGYQQKDFGANSFYTSKYPWQFEKTYGYFVAVNTSFGKKLQINPSVSYKKHFDEFQLFRQSIYKYNNGFYIHNQDTAQYAPGYYYKGHNYHKTQVIAGGIQLSFKSKWGTSNIDFNISNEQIYSNVLGKTLENPYNPYTKFAQRTYLTGTFNQTKKIGNINIGAGATLLYSKDYKAQFSGGMYANIVQDMFTYYASINSAVRLPSFTDLYYQGPSNIGNPDLKPESAISYEVGAKFKNNTFRGATAVFYRKGNHTIDWIKYHPADKWQPQNLTELQTYGAEFNLSKHFQHGFVKQLSVSYAYLKTDKMQQLFISKYALDYLKHKMVAKLAHKTFAGIQANWTLSYHNRNGQYLDYVDNHYALFDYKPYWLVNLKLHKKIRKMQYALSIENLFDTNYNDLSYIKMPGRWVMFELVYKVK